MPEPKWISVKDRLPITGQPCWIVWCGVVQLIAYRRRGLGYACVDGYVWETAVDIGFDATPDDDLVTHWQPVPEGPDHD